MTRYSAYFIGFDAGFKDGWRRARNLFGPPADPPVTRHRWYPQRERVESISPNAISPFDWGEAGSAGDRGMIGVPIDHRHPVAYYIHKYRMLAGYVAPYKTGRFPS